MKKKNRKKSALIAISSGVDSAVSALVLRERGFDVYGVHFVLYDSDHSVEQIKVIAEAVKMPLFIKDVSKTFKREIIDYFINEYKIGKTPNPCVLCNRLIKFSNLARYADIKNISYIATGHYACIGENGHCFYLKKAKDRSKDQSYFLYRLTEKELQRTIFPLCGLTKAGVKQYARNHNVHIPERESQDVCFFHAQESLDRFLEKFIEKKEGSIIDEKGNVLGRHHGCELLTIGQRHGLNLSGGPFYVIDKSIDRNEIVVTKNVDHPRLSVTKIIFKDAVWINNEPEKGRNYQIRTRYQGKQTYGILKKQNGQWIAELQAPQWGVAPGQSLVVYAADIVIGGGIISEIIES
ncbi:MAG: tRNA 2-thiouridine(34) synthase MnmA [Patescibacteria group bacterium]|nr:tRNA 2-thiouridine(34) synthase MnmA [Patescibacteria group bacterium]